MASIEELKVYFGNDQFAVDQGVEITGLGSEWATCTVALRKTHFNALGYVQGGLIFTLADFTFAVAANGRHMGTVTVNSTINYLLPAAGSRLDAKAVMKSDGGKICVYEVEVTDENGAKVAFATVTGYVRRSRTKRKQ
ncbi:MAG: PaaI family thioesterase [Oscillospiraceae bacterium]